MQFLKMIKHTQTSKDVKNRMLIFKRKSLVLLCIYLIKNTEQFEILLFSFFEILHIYKCDCLSLVSHDLSEIVCVCDCGIMCS